MGCVVMLTNVTIIVGVCAQLSNRIFVTDSEFQVWISYMYQVCFVRR